MKETGNIMAVKKSTKDQNKVSDGDHPINDISHIRSKPLLSSIVTKFPPDLYFFCWLGYLKFEKIDIGLPFRDFTKNYVVFQAYNNLIKIRINNRRFDLLETVKKGYKVKQHNIEYTAITLSTAGRKIWRQAKEDGLWDLLQKIPNSYCLEFEPFIKYFHSYYFFSHSKYLKYLKKVEEMPQTTLEAEESQDIPRDDQDLTRGLQKLERMATRSSSSTLQRKTGGRKVLLDVPKFSRINILQTIYTIAESNGRYNYDKWVTIREFIQNNSNARLYIDSVKEQEKKSKKKVQLAKLYNTLYKQIKKLHSQQLLKLYFYYKKGKRYYAVNLTLKGIAYVETDNGISKLFPLLSKRIDLFVYKYTSHSEDLDRSKMQTIFSYALIKLFSLLLLGGQIFLSVIILSSWFQEQYNTPLQLLYTFFSWLESYIYVSSILSGLLIVIPIHFAVSIIVSKKMRLSYTLLKVCYYPIVIGSLCLSISTLVFLYGF